MHVRRVLLSGVLLFLFFSALQAEAGKGKAGKLQQEGYSARDLTSRRGSAAAFQDLSVIYSSCLYDRPVEISFTPVYNTNSEYEVSPETVTVNENQSLQKVMVVFDFGAEQKFAINLHQNETACPDDDLTDAGEYYSATNAFFQYAMKTRGNTKKTTITLSHSDIWVFNAFSPFILSVMERLLDYRIIRHTVDSPLFWKESSTSKNDNGTPVFLGRVDEPIINLEYFFPDKKALSDDSPKDVCLKADRIEIQPVKQGQKQTVTVAVQHEETDYCEGTTVTLSQTIKSGQTSCDFQIPGTQLLTQNGENLLQERLESAAGFLEKAEEECSPITASPPKNAPAPYNFRDKAIIVAPPRGAPTVVVVPPQIDDNHGEGVLVHVLPHSASVNIKRH